MQRPTRIPIHSDFQDEEEGREEEDQMGEGKTEEEEVLVVCQVELVLAGLAGGSLGRLRGFNSAGPGGVWYQILESDGWDLPGWCPLGWWEKLAKGAERVLSGTRNEDRGWAWRVSGSKLGSVSMSCRMLLE